MLGNVPASSYALVRAVTYLDLSLPHDLVHDLVVVLVQHAFVVTLLVAQDAQVLRAFQLDLKFLSQQQGTTWEKRGSVAWGGTGHKYAAQMCERLTDLVPLWFCSVSEHSCLGFADKVSVRVHF